MDYVNDFNLVGADAVDQDIIGMHNRFSRSVNSAGAIEKRVFGKPLCTAFDGSKHPLCGGQITFGDIADNRRQI